MAIIADFWDFVEGFSQKIPYAYGWMLSTNEKVNMVDNIAAGQDKSFRNLIVVSMGIAELNSNGVTMPILPLSFARAGAMNLSNMRLGSGSRGTYWTSMSERDVRAYHFNLTSNALELSYFAVTNGKSYGVSVRGGGGLRCLKD